MSCAIIIPSRYGSTRFPGKPLVQICSKSLIQRVWEIARSVQSVDDVIIATDDTRIKEHASNFGANVVMTSTSCRNGTERVHDVLEKTKANYKFVVNFQGDAALTPPSVIQALVNHMKNNSGMATPAVRLTWPEIRKFQQRDPSAGSGTFVTNNAAGEALYFSRYPIPFIRKEWNEDTLKDPPVKKHIGIYAYDKDTLNKYIKLQPSTLESVEQLEQLRALENGIKIHIVELAPLGRTLWSIDTPNDVKVAEDIIAQEGEIL